MLKYCLCIIAGAWCVAAVERLPGDTVFVLVSAVFAASAAWRPCRLLAAVHAGALLLWSASLAELAHKLPASLTGIDITFDAEVIDFTQIKGESLRLLVAPVASAGLPGRVRLSWFGADRPPRLGEVWRLTARLRRPRGFSNPGGFDYAGWLFRNRIGATGYITDGEWRGDTPRMRVRLRRAVVERVDALLPEDEASAVLLAITVGARHRIARGDWDRYANTGTTHLMAISGLHVGLAAGAAFLLGRLLFALLMPRAGARDASLVIAVLTAAAYAELSGLAVPARRAVLMALLAAAGLWLRRRLSMPDVLGLSGLLIVVADPLALLAPGFRLSFAAVAILAWIGAQRTSPRQGVATGPSVIDLVRRARALGRLQGALLFGLFPLTALMFSRVSWLAPVANLLVLPVFSAITVPAGLLGVVAGGPLAALGDAALWLCWASLRAISALLLALDGLPGARRDLAAPSGFALAAVGLTMLWALLPPAWPGRRLAWPALLASILYRQPAPVEGCLDLQVLDVGQGLSVVARTANHVLVFDTGPAFRGGTDTAALVLLPFLRSVGVQRVDVAIVSHADQDHAGGLQTLLAGAEVRQVIAGEPLGALTVPEYRCRSGMRWQWDGISFDVLHPDAGDRRDGNNASCVVEVSAGRHRVLLTGDIEKPVEARLVAQNRLSPSDIVIVPHHGSRTSSSDALVVTLAPEHAIVSAGFNNRWGFPKPDIVARWQNAGAIVSTTATDGALGFRVCRDGGIDGVRRWRERSRRYWHDSAE